MGRRLGILNTMLPEFTNAHVFAWELGCLCLLAKTGVRMLCASVSRSFFHEFSSML